MKVKKSALVFRLVKHLQHMFWDLTGFLTLLRFTVHDKALLQQIAVYFLSMYNITC